MFTAFQSTHPCGVRPLYAKLHASQLKFQSTHPCGVRPASRWIQERQGEFQSTHPCGVRLYINRAACCCVVSIHAPVWGATSFVNSFGLNTRFQSTHPCGVRRYTSRADSARPGFNPRTRVGCDSLTRGIKMAVKSFNPRTRVGCDPAKILIKCSAFLFQSTHPCGVRPLMIVKLKGWLLFQSTHPCGVRPHGKTTTKPSNRFNPRTRVGCDFNTNGNRHKQKVSIHAPVWGATLEQASKTVTGDVSIHAPVWGATQWRFLPWQPLRFQSTHPCGVRLCYVDSFVP